MYHEEAGRRRFCIFKPLYPNFGVTVATARKLESTPQKAKRKETRDSTL